MNNSFIDLGDGYFLEHHGVLGMKWGIRRYQPYSVVPRKSGKGGREIIKGDSPRKYKRALNKADQDYADAAAKYMSADARQREMTNKSNRAFDKGNKEKAKSIAYKTLEVRKERDEYAKLMKDVDSWTWKVMAEAAQKGYTVESKEFYRNGERGKDFATFFLLGSIPGSGVAIGQRIARSSAYKGYYQTVNKRGQTIDQYPWMIKGNKYKVKRG